MNSCMGMKRTKNFRLIILDMDYQIIDNALPEKEFEDLRDTILCPDFPWNLSPIVTNNAEKLPKCASYYFTHLFWDGFEVQSESQLFAPILRLIQCNAVIRIKANCYPSTYERILHDNHCDYEFAHKGAIYYLNTNNGLTILEDEVEVESVENRLLLFDPSKPHRSVTCTDDKCRVNVNFNYF